MRLEEVEDNGGLDQRVLHDIDAQRHPLAAFKDASTPDTVLFGTDDPAHGIKSETWAYEQHLAGPDGKTITIVQSPEPLLDDRFAVGSVGGRDAYASDIGRAIEFQIGSAETVRIYGPNRDYALFVQVASGLAAG